MEELQFLLNVILKLFIGNAILFYNFTEKYIFQVLLKEY